MKNNNNIDATGRDAIMKGENMISKANEMICAFKDSFSSKAKKIAVIRLYGVIGKASKFQSGISLASCNEQIEQAFNMQGVSAVCLLINSPGGSPVQSELVATRIRSLAKKKGIKIYSFIEDVGASGGYWIACAGDEIYASKSSIVGSIGVISRNFGFHKVLEKLGIERRVYNQGKNKSVLDPFKPENPDDIKIILKMQKEIYDYFVEYVKSRRAGKLTQNDDILFNGEFWCGKTAMDYGLIDGISDMYSFIEDKFGKDVKIEEVKTKESWIKKKITGSMANILNSASRDAIKSAIEIAREEEIESKFRFF